MGCLQAENQKPVLLDTLYQIGTFYFVWPRNKKQTKIKSKINFLSQFFLTDPVWTCSYKIALKIVEKACILISDAISDCEAPSSLAQYTMGTIIFWIKKKYSLNVDTVNAF